MVSLQLTAPNMACSSCGETIMTATQEIDRSAQVAVDSQTKQVNVETQASATSLKAAATKAGYTVV